jgi:hypothetical protein
MFGALKNPTSKQTLRDLLQGRSVNQLFKFIRDTLDNNRKTPNMPYDGAITHMLSLFEAVRTKETTPSILLLARCLLIPFGSSRHRSRMH